MNRLSMLTRLRQFAPWALVLLSAVAAGLAALQALDYPFISDDVVYVAMNTRLSALPLTELWRLFIEPYNSESEFLPLREFSYWLDMALFGMTPSVFRATNITLYLLCLPLVYGVTLKLWQLFRAADRPEDAASAPWAAAAVTALFALNPSHVEAVVWISGRKDVLSGLFSLLALWLALRVKREQGFSARYAAAALLALLAAMLSKATAVAMAPVIAMFWAIFWFNIPASSGKRHRSLLLWPLASLLLALCVALVFSTFITTRIPLYFGIEAVTRSLAVLGWLARLAVSPESRHFIYPVFEDPYLHVMALVGAAVLIAVGVVILRKCSPRSLCFQSSQYSIEGFALVIFLLLCLPSVQLIPYALPSLVSDRFVFLAVWPTVLLIVVLSWRLDAALRTVLLLTIALSWSIQTAERPRDWRSFGAIIDADLRAYPGNTMLTTLKIFAIQSQHTTFRDVYEMAKKITDQERRNDVFRMIETDYAVYVGAGLRGSPKEAMALLWQGGLDLKQMPVQAQWNSPLHNLWRRKETWLILEWEYLAKHFPDDVSVHYNAGLWMLEVKQYSHAVAHLRAATESRRLQELERGTAFYNLGLALIGDKRVVDAEAPLYAALMQSPPDLRAYCLLADVYRMTNRIDQALHAKSNCLIRASNAAVLL